MHEAFVLAGEQMMVVAGEIGLVSPIVELGGGALSPCSEALVCMFIVRLLLVFLLDK
jgi:hypothetical protein